MNGLLGVLRHEVLIPLALPIALVLLALILRSGRALWFRLKQQGFPPIVLHAANDIQSRAFAARLSEYLAREAPGAAVIIPPGSGPLPPPVPVEELTIRGGWLAALVGIVLSREPAFEVYVERPRQSLTEPSFVWHRSIIRITRVPGNRVLATDHLEYKHEEELIDAAGCLAIHSIRQQPGILRHTPRWERWSPDINGYSTYRRALDYERQGKLGNALETYDLALRYEPGNFLINIRKAAVLEVQGKFKEASEVYRTCYELWPEHVETAYRLSASYANYGNHRASTDVLRGIKYRLKRRILWGERGKTWWLTRWNIGERRYWSSWLRRHPRIFGSSNRHHFLMAVRVAEQVRGMGAILSPSQGHQGNIATLLNNMAELTTRGAPASLVARMARLTTRRPFTSPCIHIFHPELLLRDGSGANRLAARQRNERHDSSWHNSNDDNSQVIYPVAPSRLPRRFRPRKRIGWLAHYNAACFYSLALKLEDDTLRPVGYGFREWKIDCARAAIRELGHVRRDPLSEIEPDWYRRDPELGPLRGYFKDTRWAKLVGL